MTSTIIVQAHPAPPNNVVRIHVYDGSGDGKVHILEDGAERTFYIHGDMHLTAEETSMEIVRKRFVGEDSTGPQKPDAAARQYVPPAPKAFYGEHAGTVMTHDPVTGMAILPQNEAAPNATCSLPITRAFTNDAAAPIDRTVVSGQTPSKRDAEVDHEQDRLMPGKPHAPSGEPDDGNPPPRPQS